jgi:hypothetical protein
MLSLQSTGFIQIVFNILAIFVYTVLYSYFINAIKIKEGIVLHGSKQICLQIR